MSRSSKRAKDRRRKDVVAWFRRVVTGPTTQVPVLSGIEWSPLHGQRTRNGALKGETNTDYMVWTCPNCSQLLMGGAGIRLIGSAFDFADTTKAHCDSLLLEIDCVSCDFLDHFKIPVDQHKRYHEESCQ